MRSSWLPFLLLLLAETARAACSENTPGVTGTGQTFEQTINSDTISITVTDGTDSGQSIDVRCQLAADGHSWLIAPANDNGSLTIKSKSPAQTSGSGWTDNGAEVDPTSQHAGQGLNEGDDCGTFAGNVTLPYTINTGTVGRPVSFITTRTHADKANGGSTGSERTCNEHVEIFSILPTMPTVPTFRPPYFGTDKPLYTVYDINWPTLPQLPDSYSFDFTPELAFNTWGVHLWGTSGGEEKHMGRQNQLETRNSTWPAQTMEALAPQFQTGFVACATDAECDDKRATVKVAVQRVIDVLQIWIEGGNDNSGGAPGEHHPDHGGWAMTGGFNNGHGGEILFACEILDLWDTACSGLATYLASTEGQECGVGAQMILNPPNASGKNVWLWGGITGKSFCYQHSQGGNQRQSHDVDGKVDGDPTTNNGAGGKCEATNAYYVPLYMDNESTGTEFSTFIAVWAIEALYTRVTGWGDLDGSMAYLRRIHEPGGGAYCDPDSFDITPRVTGASSGGPPHDFDTDAYSHIANEIFTDIEDCTPTCTGQNDGERFEIPAPELP